MTEAQGKRKAPAKKKAPEMGMEDFGELMAGMEKVMAAANRIAMAAAKIRPVLEKLAAFEEWASGMPGKGVERGSGQRPEISSPPRPVPTEWTAPAGYHEIGGVNGKAVESLPGYNGGVEKIEPVKYGPDPSGQLVPVVGKVTVGGRVIYWSPEPVGNTEGRFWAEGDLIQILMRYGKEGAKAEDSPVVKGSENGL